MTTTQDQPADAEEQRLWLVEYKALHSLSWGDLARVTGIAQGTISQFGAGTYKGDVGKYAREVASYRQMLNSQAELEIEFPEPPSYFPTQTSAIIEQHLAYAHRGRISAVATGAGCGKTTTAQHYQQNMPNVWLATMAESSSGLNTMQQEVLRSMGFMDPVGTPLKLSRQIKEKVKGTGGLIIVDEANKLTEKAVEEVRSWHDATGIGIALLGNETVISRLEGGSRKAAYAQLFSRVGLRHIQNYPTAADAEALCDAWKMEEPRVRARIIAIARKDGGLRQATKVLEIASILSSANGETLGLTHVQDACSQLISRSVFD